ncbi:UbiA family prenyltransferase [Oceanicella actignis]|uniref:UbiA family prenyltransferase n=1 Tax=Oceanicella actignis TaxID=1189325 RepID=UPI000933CF43|nr:UbiA family prenyltransferase [Oceanicella actignis]
MRRPGGAQADEAERRVLVVDLDRTLIRTDMLLETFFAALARAPLRTLAALGALRRGRAAFKAALADIARPDPRALPIEPAVKARIEAARAAGERVALVTATDERVAREIADALGLFDEVHGSTPERNLKGEAKAALLTALYGERGFDYVGDSAADLAVWRHARTAITVGAGPRLRRLAEGAAPRAEHLAPPQPLSRRLIPHLRALRPHQWLKNALIFVPPLAAHRFDGATLGAAALGFACFSLTASCVYIVNDLLDLSADRAHPRKRHRPLASGALPIAHGLAMAPVLLGGAFALALAALPAGFSAVLAIYFALTLAYSLTLKRRLVIDICTLAGLYTLRVFAGGAATELAISPWTLAFFGFLFLSLAAMKRQTELVDGLRSGRARAAGRAYQVEDLPIVAMMAVAAGYLSVLVLALYISNDATRALYSSPQLLWWALPVLLYWISRMVMLAHRGRMTDDPLVFATRDPVSLACGAATLAAGAAGAWL